jgi:hypothetical protein
MAEGIGMLRSDQFKSMHPGFLVRALKKRALVQRLTLRLGLAKETATEARTIAARFGLRDQLH